MTEEKKCHGVVIPMITPFTENRNIDKFSAVRITRHICDAGTYPFLLGTTGEAASVPVHKRIELIKSVKSDLKNGMQMYAGISDNCIETSIFLAKTFADLGVDYMVAHLPSYYPLNSDHMLKHYERLADQSPAPLIIYNILSTTRMSIPLNVLEKLSYHDNIAGVKDSERDLERLKKMSEKFTSRTDFSILCGWTTQSFHALSLGFDGIVPNPGNVSPKLFQDLYRSVKSGNKGEARQLQIMANELADVFQKDRILSEIIAGLKVMMSAMELCEPWVLPPLTRIDSKEEKKIKEKMSQVVAIKE
jgi:4-hydroxy-tetrahydrodipicolinate synthase